MLDNLFALLICMTFVIFGRIHGFHLLAALRGFVVAVVYFHRADRWAYLEVHMIQKSL
jgi:hypothetical protein